MAKKFFYILIFALLAASGAYFFTSGSISDKTCAFCDEKVIDKQKFYEDDLIMVLYTHKPVLPGHTLIIPKRHVERFEMLTDQEILQMGKVIKKVNKAVSKVFGTSAYLLLQKNGKEVGQSVPHVHVHYIPRKAGDTSTSTFLLRMYLSNFLSPISPQEMQENVEKLKTAMTQVDISDTPLSERIKSKG